jgi:hypothetical protein
MLASMAGAFWQSLPLAARTSPMASTSKVVLIRDENAINENGNVNKAVLQQMVRSGMLELTGKSSEEAAWQSLFAPGDIVGIKTNVWRYLSTPKELEDITREHLIKLGIKKENISISDRGVLRDPVFKKSTAMINMRPMRTHDWSGLGTLLKNYIMFVDKPYAYHDDSCADLATIWKLPLVQGKTRLNILVMLTPLFHGIGPHHFNKKYVWKYHGIIMGQDPVAVDYTGMRIIQEKRNLHFGEERPINPSPKHIELADTRHHLGNANPDKIELVKIGWGKDILI